MRCVLTIWCLDLGCSCQISRIARITYLLVLGARLEKYQSPSDEEIDLIREADADAEENAAEDEHVDVEGGTAEGRTSEEGSAAGEDWGAAAEGAGDGGGEEGGDEAGYVEGWSEGGEEVAVELAVVADLGLLLHLPVHFREELPEKWLHGCHSTFTPLFIKNSQTC